MFASNTELNNTAGFVYGGDLLGNVWRFDINTEDKFLFAELEDSSGNPQPITTGPELGLVNGKTIVLIGTGKYLEDSDRNNTQKQSFYAIVEKSPAATVSGRSTLVNKNFNKDGSGNRSIGNTANVDYDTKRGWFIDFIDNGERVNVKPRLELGAILLPSIVPSAATCSPGGFGYLNILGFQNGNAVPGNAISKKYGSPIVGINVVYIGGKPVASAVTADDPVPKKVDFIPPNSTSGFQKKRVIWRELTD